MKIFLPLLVLLIILIPKPEYDETVTIPEESIRFRIIANSNSIEDQELKMKIVNDISYTLFNDLKNVHDYNEAQKIINSSKEEIEKSVAKYTSTYNINYGYNYFPEKEYLGKTYNAGEYESLVINLDNSKGNNFWCVLFPPLCLLEAQDNHTDEIQYRSLVKDIINKVDIKQNISKK